MSLLAGTLAGLITGLFPSLHVNLVTLLSIRLLQESAYIDLFTYITALSISSAIFNVIPLIFFSIPDSPETLISYNPIVNFFSKGKAYEAFLLTIIGSLSSVIFLILLTPILIFIYPRIFNFIKPSTSLLLILIAVFMIKKEPNSKLWALITFLFAGILGILTLTNNSLKEPLLPLLSGLFAIPTMVTNLKHNLLNVKQQITQPDIHIKTLFTTIPLSLLISFFSTFLPAIGPSQSAVLISSIRKFSQKETLILTGSITAFNTVLSLISLYSINKARNGSIESLRQVISKFTINNLIYSLTITLIVASLSTVIAILLSRKFISYISYLKLEKLSLFFLIFTIALIFFISGPKGLLISIVGASIGFIPILKNINRNHLMACIILPVIFYTLN